MLANIKSTFQSKKKLNIEKIVVTIIFAIISLIWILPFLYMIGLSFKPPIEIGIYPEKLFPTWGNWSLENYAKLFFSDEIVGAATIFIWLGNSLEIGLLTVILTIIFDTLAAYAFTFLNFKGRKWLFALIIGSMAIPGCIGTAPSFSIYAQIANSSTGLGNSRFYNYFWLIVPATTSVFNLFLVKNFYDTIPFEIVESARSDGASDFKIFRKIIFPLAKNTILICALFTFVGSWNNFLFPSLIFGGKSTHLYTITYGLTMFTNGDSWEIKGVAMASSVLSLIPIVVLFLFTQNKMIDGLASTGIKE